MPDAAVPAAPIAQAATAAAPLLRAAWKDIHRSPLNPRKHFETGPLQELADSIAVQGVLQNLVVRPHPTKPNEYELVAGERRHRAYELLIKAGKAKPEDQLPVQIRKLDDREAGFIALTENVSRNDLTPLEEGEAFANLRRLGVQTKDLARAIGKTERFVQKRMRLVGDLDEVAVKALKAGTISVEQANVLAMVPKERHQDLVKAIVAGHVGDTDQLKDLATEQLVPVGKQAFPVDAYKGAFVVDEDTPTEPGKQPMRWFRDTAQVQKLLKAEIVARRTKLEGNHAFVEVKKSDQGTGRPWDWDKLDKATSTSGALLVWCPGTAEIEVHAPVRKPAPRNSVGTPPAKEVAYRGAFAHFYDSLATDTLLTAIAGNATLALRFAVLQALDATHYGSPPPDAVTNRWNDLTRKLVAMRDRAARWKALQKLDVKALAEILAFDALMRSTERDLINNGSGDKPPGLDDGLAAIAADAKADVGKLWRFYGEQADAFLEVCGPQQLSRVAADLGIAIPAGANDATIRAAIAKEVAKHRNYMPPWLALDTSDGIAKRLKAQSAKKKG